MTPIRTCTNAPATAQLFVQLSLRRRCCSAPAMIPTQLPILGYLLLPAATAARRARHAGASASRATAAAAAAVSLRNIQFGGGDRWRGRAARRIIAAQRPQQQHLRRGFSTTVPRRAGTEAIYNPQNDEDGKEMVLEITPRAAKRLSDIMGRDSNPYLALRIQVESGGCHGFQYLMSLVTLPPELPSAPPSSSSDTAAAEEEDDSDGAAIREDDTIFAYLAGDDAEGEKKKALEAPKIILDGPSLDLLKGSKVDFTMELIGSQFKIVDNPLATSSCGCGTSFDIKM